MEPRDATVRWRQVSDLLISLERIVQANLVMDTRTSPFRLPAQAADAEQEIRKLTAVVEAALDRLTSERLTHDLKQQRLTGVQPRDSHSLKRKVR